MRKMNHLIIFILFIGLLFSFPSYGEAVIPEPTNDFFVNDFAKVIDASDEQAIQFAAVQLQEATTAQVVVVTVDSLQGEPLEDYAYQLFKQWGIGTAQQNNGVLILVSVGDRQSRIEVGYGLEGALPDGKTGRIQDEYMIPYFKDNDYGSGIRNGFLAIVQQVYDEYGIDPGGLEMPDRAFTTETDTGESDNANMVLFIIIIIVLLIDWIFLRGRITRFILMASMYNRRGGGHYRGGGGSHRGGGGGFSGGGGRSGGGGSSRGW